MAKNVVGVVTCSCGFGYEIESLKAINELVDALASRSMMALCPACKRTVRLSILQAEGNYHV